MVVPSGVEPLTYPLGKGRFTLIDECTCHPLANKSSLADTAPSLGLGSCCSSSEDFRPPSHFRPYQDAEQTQPMPSEAPGRYPSNAMTIRINEAGTFPCEVEKPSSWFEEGPSGVILIHLPLRVAEGRSFGKKVYWFGYLSERAIANTIADLCKAFPDWDGDLSALVSGAYSFAGKPCEIVVEEFTFEGSPHFGATEIHAAGHRQAGIEKKVLALLDRLPVSKGTPERKKGRLLAGTPR